MWFEQNQMTASIKPCHYHIFKDEFRAWAATCCAASCASLRGSFVFQTIGALGFTASSFRNVLPLLSAQFSATPSAYNNAHNLLRRIFFIFFFFHFFVFCFAKLRSAHSQVRDHHTHCGVIVSSKSSAGVAKPENCGRDLVSFPFQNPPYYSALGSSHWFYCRSWRKKQKQNLFVLKVYVERSFVVFGTLQTAEISVRS